MENRHMFRIIALIAMTVLMLCAAIAASAMEITVIEHHSPSEDLVGPGEGISYADNGNGSFNEVIPTPAPADYSSLWIGEYVLADEPDSTLSITPGENGKLHMSAFFLRMTGIEAEIIPYDELGIRFEDNDGAYYGGIHREKDGSIRLAVCGGSDLGPDSAMREFFLMNDFYFVKEGQECKADPGDKLRRMTGEGLTNAGREGEKYKEADRYHINEEGSIVLWEHTEYDEDGYRTIQRSGDHMTVEEFDTERRKTRRTEYDSGVIRSSEIYSYNADGKQTCMHKIEYERDGLKHSFDYFDYDAEGCQTATRKYNSEGRGGIYEKYEYFDDGSKVIRYYTIYGAEAGKLNGEAWFDAGDRMTRSVAYVDGEVYTSNETEYTLDMNGKVIRESFVRRSGDGKEYHTVREMEYDKNGRLIRQTEKSPEMGVSAVGEYFRNSKGQTICQYSLNEYLVGENSSISATDTEYEFDASDVRQLTSRHYEYSSALYGRLRHLDYTYYYLYEGDQGTRLGISPLPMQGNGEIHSLIPDDFIYALREMTREDVTITFHARKVGECIYDSEDQFELGGYTGALRFVFESRGSNRLQSVWWVCSGDPEAAYSLKSKLAGEGVEWSQSSGWDKPDALGLTETTGTIGDSGGIRLVSGSRGGQALAYVTCHYVWYEPEEGLAMPWEQNGNRAYLSDTESEYGTGIAETPAEENREADVNEPEPESEPEPEIAAEPEPEVTAEPETDPEITAESEPEPETEQEWTDNAEWTGYWMSGGDEQGEMVTTVDENGALRMKAMFMRTFDIEAELKRQDNTHCTFETEYGHYSGVVTRISDRELHFAITGGMSMEDDENEWYYLFKDRDYTFEPADYADLWYEEPADGPEDDNDWTGNWTAHGEGMTSGIRIIRGVQGNFIIQLTFSNGYMIAGELERVDSRRMDFDAEDFGAVLTLNRKHRTILMTDLGSMDEAASEALDAFHYILEFVPEGNGTGIQPTREEPAKQPDPEPVPELPESSLIPEVEAIPINGKPGYEYIPVNLADSTSYIVGKDPEAYIPFRMIDGDEKTCYQFSAKESKLGEAYVYFFFETCGSFDEIWIKNGFWKKSDGKDQYLRNSRVKTMTVEFSYPDGDGYRDAVSVSLKDDKKRKDWTVISLDHKTQVHAVRFRIDSIYQGTKFKNDVCISEVMFVKRTDHE